MTGRHTAILLLVCMLLVIFGGCTDVSVEDTRYQSGNILVNLTSSTDIPEGWLQITIFTTRDLHQQEIGFIQSPVNIRSGKNSLIIPSRLEPGSYKLYIYVLADGERRTATIRDIEV